MRRITTTVFGIIAIIIILYIRAQASQMPAPFMIFNLVTLMMIILIVISIIRAWLSGP